LINDKNDVLEKLYLRTQGQPIKAILEGLRIVGDKGAWKIKGVGTTGSGRQLASVIVGGDVVKNEITAHGVAAMAFVPNVRTIFEIGGQDSKIVFIREGVILDFAMNTVCAAGTGSFLDRQASRLNIPIEKFGELALRAQNEVRIAGRCAVFAESDMIHKQQMGYNVEDIARGLCEALVRNYLSNVGKSKKIEGPIVFQGGVAANVGIKKAFEDAVGQEVIIPEHFDVMGAVGSAILAREHYNAFGKTNFKGFNIISKHYATKSFECADCPNNCEVVSILEDNIVLACWGDRCGKWNNKQGEFKEKLA